MGMSEYPSMKSLLKLVGAYILFTLKTCFNPCFFFSSLLSTPTLSPSSLQAGMNWEHSLLDGHTMMEFFAPVGGGLDEVAFGCPQPCEAIVPSAEAPSPPPAKPLPWGSGLDAPMRDAIAQQVNQSLALAQSCGVETLEFNEYGGTTIKSLKCSPDGFAQAAFLLTFYAIRGRVPSPYESVLAKAYKHGRVTVE